MNGDVKKAKNIVGAFVEQKLNGEDKALNIFLLLSFTEYMVKSSA